VLDAASWYLIGCNSDKKCLRKAVFLEAVNKDDETDYQME
jgi:hypothetical protein